MAKELRILAKGYKDRTGTDRTEFMNLDKIANIPKEKLSCK